MNPKKLPNLILITITSLIVLLPLLVGCIEKVENEHQNNILLIKLPAKQSTQARMIKSEKIKRGAKNNFCLVSGNLTADILVDKNDSKTILLAAKLFSEDIERITGNKAEIKDQIKSISSECVIIGSIEENEIIRKLIEQRKIDVTDIKGKWESCLIQIVRNPHPGIDIALVIAGSDRRGTAYGVLELSKQIGVSPWYYFADVSLKKQDEIYIKDGRFIQKSPSVKYRGIFINDEMWGIRPWAMNTLAPEEGKGIGPTTYRKVFELLIRLKANLLWPAMHQQTKPFNYYEENKRLADEFGIIMGSSHIEPMLRNNIAGAEWDSEYPDEPWDYVKNKDHIYKYWEERIKQNGNYENIYTIGKRGKDDEAGSDITLGVLEEIFSDQRDILRKWVNKNVEKVPQVLIPYTEVLNLYNEGLKVPDDVIICWPDDNFGNMRQLPDKEEQQRPGGSGIYYHFQWLNGATTAYPWLYTTPLGLTWSELKKAYDFNVRKLWVVNVGDIKPAEIGIEFFMQMAWNIEDFAENNPRKFLMDWVSRDFGKEYASQIADIMEKHYELAYARRPENMVMYNGRENKISWEWFSLNNYNDEVQRRIDAYDILINKTDEIYKSLPEEMKDAFFQMVVYNVKGAGLQNKKVLYAQKSNTYGKQNRASAARYAAMAQQAENEIHQLIHHYNRELVTVGDKWDHMASLPGPWGGQWQQWAMPPLNYFAGNEFPKMNIAVEGVDKTKLPGFSVFNKDKRFIDLYNTGNGVVYWSSNVSNDWIKLSEESGVISDEQRIWVTIDWEKAPEGNNQKGQITFNWISSSSDIWMNYDGMSDQRKEKYKSGTLGVEGPGTFFNIDLSIFNPSSPSKEKVLGFVESNGYISIEAEHYSRKTDQAFAAWRVIEGLGRTGNSITVLPVNISAITSPNDIIIKSPLLEYDIYTFTEGEVEIYFNCIPSYPINANYESRIAVAIDEGEPFIVPSGGRNVMENLMKINTKLNIEQKGQHILKVWMVDPGIILDKIIINTGDMQESYLGPPESVYNNAK